MINKQKTGIEARYDNINNIKKDLIYIKENEAVNVTYQNKQKLISLGYLISEDMKPQEKKKGRPRKNYTLTKEAEIFISK